MSDIPETVTCASCGATVAVADSWHAFYRDGEAHLCEVCYDAYADTTLLPPVRTDDDGSEED